MCYKNKSIFSKYLKYFFVMRIVFEICMLAIGRMLGSPSLSHLEVQIIGVLLGASSTIFQVASYLAIFYALIKAKSNYEKKRAVNNE